MELREALIQISRIRQQVAQTEIFRGFRALPVAFSGVLALTSAAVQAVWLPDPTLNMTGYLILWISAAVVSLIATGICVLLHCQHAASPVTRTTALLVISQFVPCLVVGAVITFVLYQQGPQTLGWLPGLWASLFSLGIFASYRLLPRATFWVGVHYLLTGSLVLSWADDGRAFSPWAMAITFGIGQLLAAAVLYWTLERSDEQL